jgi:hypothetical protein
MYLFPCASSLNFLCFLYFFSFYSDYVITYLLSFSDSLFSSITLLLSTFKFGNFFLLYFSSKNCNLIFLMFQIEESCSASDTGSMTDLGMQINDAGTKIQFICQSVTVCFLASPDS